MELSNFFIVLVMFAHKRIFLTETKNSTVGMGGNNYIELMQYQTTQQGKWLQLHNLCVCRKSQEFYSPPDPVAKKIIYNSFNPTIQTNIVKPGHSSYDFTNLEYLAYMCRGDLSEYPLPKEAISALILNIILTVDAFHKEGITHGDIKLKNILLGDDGLPKFIDFDYAIRIKQVVNLSLSSLSGTPGHFSPLDGQFEKEYDSATLLKARDIWALGITLYDLLIGFSFYEIALLENKILITSNSRFKAARKKNPEICKIIGDLLTGDPRERLGKFEALVAHREIYECFKGKIPGQPINLTIVSPETKELTEEGEAAIEAWLEKYKFLKSARKLCRKKIDHTTHNATYKKIVDGVKTIRTEEVKKILINKIFKAEGIIVKNKVLLKNKKENKKALKEQAKQEKEVAVNEVEILIGQLTVSDDQGKRLKKIFEKIKQKTPVPTLEEWHHLYLRTDKLSSDDSAIANLLEVYHREIENKEKRLKIAQEILRTVYQIDNYQDKEPLKQLVIKTQQEIAYLEKNPFVAYQGKKLVSHSSPSISYIPSSNEWKEMSNVSFAFRTKETQRIDKLVENYGKSWSDREPTLQQLIVSCLAWLDKKTNTSDRIFAMEELLERALCEWIWLHRQNLRDQNELPEELILGHRLKF